MKVTAVPESAGFELEVIVVVVGASYALTTCVAVPDATPYLESPRYSAVMTCEPTLSAAVANEHEPRVREQFPIVSSPFSILTVPVGVSPEPVTVTLIDIEDPKFDGDGEVDTETVGVGFGAIT